MFHQHFSTPERGGAIRSYYLATALVQRGHQVTMITSGPSKARRTEHIEGIEVIYLPIPYNNRFSFYARVWSFIRYALAAIRAGSGFRDYDVCYGISVPLTVGLCTRWMKFRYGIPYLFEVGDLWPDAPIQLGYIKNWFFKRAMFAFERDVYRHAHALVALSGPIQTAILQKIPTARVHIIPNMADCDFYHPEEKDPKLESLYAVKGRFVVSYIGALGAANGVHHLIDCAEACQTSALSVQFIICGDGAMLAELKSISKQKALTNVTFIAFSNRAEVQRILNITDSVFVSYKKADILETGCPNKYFDGLAAGKLIIVNFGGWIRSEVELYKCGFFVDTRQPSAFVEKIEQFLSDRTLLEAAQRNSRELAERVYSRNEISEAFQRVFSDL